MHKFKILNIFLFILIQFFSSKGAVSCTEATEIKRNNFMNKYKKSEGNSPARLEAEKYFESLNENSDKESWVDPYDMFNYDSFSHKTFVENENNAKYSFNNDKKTKSSGEISKRNEKKTDLKINLNNIGSDKTSSPEILPAKDTSNGDERTSNKIPCFTKEQGTEGKINLNGIDITTNACENQNEVITSESTEILQTEMNKYLNYDSDKSSCNGKDYIFLKRWLKKLLKKLQNSPYIESDEMKTLQFIVTNKELQGIQKFIDFPSQNILDLETVVSDAIAGADVFVERAEPWWTNAFSYASSYKVQILWMFCILMIIFIWILRPFPLFTLKTIILLITFISVFWHWIHLYKKQLAKKLALLDSLTYPPECQKAELSIWQSVSLWVKSYFVLEDNCMKYYEAATVDPFWEVSPLMALSETLANFLLQPLGAIGHHFKSFIKELFSDLPFFYCIPIIIFITVLLVMLCNYQLKLPFFLGALEPAPQSWSHNRIEVNPIINRIEVLPDTGNEVDNKNLEKMQEIHNESEEILQTLSNQNYQTETNVAVKKYNKESLNSEIMMSEGNPTVISCELKSTLNFNSSLEELPN